MSAAAADDGDMDLSLFGTEEPVAPPAFVEFQHERATGREPLCLVKCDDHHSLWGNQLWNAGRYLVERIDKGSIDVMNKLVLELGSGLGAPSIAAAANGARVSVATDYPEKAVMSLLERNIDANREMAYREAQARRATADVIRRYGTEEALQAMPLLWGSESHAKAALAISGGGGYDVLILSDVVFNHICHDALLRTVSQLLARSPTARAYVAFSHHRYLKQQDDLRFFTLAADYGLKAELEEVRHDFPLMFPDDPGPDEIRKPVWCYTLQHEMDAAGSPCDETNVDVVVLGTGLVEAMVSAACAKSRLKVLHLEAADFYGSGFASGHRDEFEKIVKRIDGRAVFSSPALDDLRRRVAAAAAAAAAPTNESEQPQTTAAELEAQIRTLEQQLRSRSVSLDLNPFVDFADSQLVAELAGSQMGTHLEYQNISRLAIIDATAFPAAKVVAVPLSRSAAFNSSALGPMDMRRLVALVKDLSGTTLVPEGTEGEDVGEGERVDSDDAIVDKICASATSDESLRAVLARNYRVSPAVEELLTLGGVVVDAGECRARPGAFILRKFISSIGRYGGPTPFLVSQYGSSEVPQIMCRMAAVWESSFVLKRTVAVVEPCDRLTSADESPEAKPLRPAARAVAPMAGVFSRSPEGTAVILSNGQRITTKVLVLPKQCADLHPASPSSRPQPSGELPGSQHADVRASRAVIVLRRAAVTWDVLEPSGVPQDDSVERELRQGVPVPLVVGAFKFRRPPATASDTPATVTASFVQLSAASQHAPVGWSVLHFTAPATQCTPNELLTAATGVYGAEAADVVFTAAFILSSDSVGLQAIAVTDVGDHIPSPQSLVVHWKQMARRGEDGTHTIAHVDRTAITVVPITTFMPFGLDDDRYLDEARSAWSVIVQRCGVSDAEPFLSPSQQQQAAAE